MELRTLDDVGKNVSRSLDAELANADRTFDYTSTVRGRLARSLENIIYKDGESSVEASLEVVPVLLKALSDQDRAQNAIVSSKLRRQETETAQETARIISDALAAEESVRAIPDDITAPPPIPKEMESLIFEKIKPTELKTNPMDFSGE